MPSQGVGVQLQQPGIGADIAPGEGVPRQPVKAPGFEITQGGLRQVQMGCHLFGTEADPLALAAQQLTRVDDILLGAVVQFFHHQEDSDAASALASGVAGYRRRSCNA